MPSSTRTIILRLIRPRRTAHAHTGTHSYAIVEIDGGRATGTVQFPIDILNEALSLEIPLDETNAIAAIDAAREPIDAYIRDHFSINDASSPWPIEFTGRRVLERKQFSYAIFSYEVPGLEPVPEQFTVTYDGIVATDETHEGMVIVRQHAGFGALRSKQEQRWPVVAGSTVFTASTRPNSPATNVSGAWRAVTDAGREYLRRARKRIRRTLGR